jgi:hypothetical protein
MITDSIVSRVAADESQLWDGWAVVAAAISAALAPYRAGRFRFGSDTLRLDMV